MAGRRHPGEDQGRLDGRELVILLDLRGEHGVVNAEVMVGAAVPEDIAGDAQAVVVGRAEGIFVSGGGLAGSATVIVS